MHKCLYFLCPTDCLESTINSTFRYDNYFYTSLGNSVIFDDDKVLLIKRLIRKHTIREISFVLSNNNRVVMDALENQIFSEIRGLNNFCSEIIKQKKHSEVFGQSNNSQFSILSYYLNKKIKDFQFELNSLVIDQIKISGKIYNKQENIFDNIYSHLICLEHFRQN